MPAPTPRLLTVVAHPDDETFGCGSVLLWAAARGWTTSVCCATRGEAGEPATGSGVRPEELPDVRTRELHDAADVLGVGTVALLAFRDSGMDGPADSDTLVGAPFEDVVAAVAAVIEERRPDVVLTLDASDGHRDHVRIRDATLAAVDAGAGGVERVYLQCLPRSLMRRWADHQRTVSPDSPYLDVDAAAFGTPDEDVTTVIDTSAHLEDRRAAMACHASQVTPYDGLPEELARDFLATDHLRRVRPAWPEGTARETELGGVPSR